MPKTETQILGPLAGALIGAVLALVFFILPAEYGIDATGFGRLTGLTQMSEAREDNTTLARSTSPLSHDNISFVLQPYETIEVKYRLKKSDTIVYAWASSVHVDYDMHAQPDGADQDFSQSYADGKANEEAGSYTAPFSGIHGWYWENRNSEPADISIFVAGFAEDVTVFRDGTIKTHTTRIMGGNDD